MAGITRWCHKIYNELVLAERQRDNTGMPLTVPERDVCIRRRDWLESLCKIWMQNNGTHAQIDAFDAALPSQRFSARVIGDGSADSRAKIFKIVLFAVTNEAQDSDAAHQLLRHFIDRLELQQEKDPSLENFRDSHLPFCHSQLDHAFPNYAAARLFDRIQYNFFDGTSWESDRNYLRDRLQESMTFCKTDETSRRSSSNPPFLRKSTLKSLIETNRSYIARLGKALLVERYRNEPEQRHEPILNRVKTFVEGVVLRPRIFATLVLMQAPTTMWQEFINSCQLSGEGASLTDVEVSAWCEGCLRQAFKCGKYDAYKFHNTHHSTCAMELEHQQQTEHNHEGESRLPLLSKSSKKAGFCGEVYKVEIAGEYCKGFGLDDKQNLVCAMKKLDAEYGDHEWSIMRTLFEQPNHCDNVMKALASAKTKHEVYIFYPWAEHDLLEYMMGMTNAPGSAQQAMLIHLLRDVWAGNEYLLQDLVRGPERHRFACLHMDIQPENVVTMHKDGRPQALITDFSIALTTSHQNRITPKHVRLPDVYPHYPPEADEHNMDARRVTTWQFGVLLIYVVACLRDGKAGIEEFKNAVRDDKTDDCRLYRRINAGDVVFKPELIAFLDKIFDEINPVAGNIELNGALRGLVDGMTAINEQYRLSFQEISDKLEHISRAVEAAVSSSTPEPTTTDATSVPSLSRDSTPMEGSAPIPQSPCDPGVTESVSNQCTNGPAPQDTSRRPNSMIVVEVGNLSTANGVLEKTPKIIDNKVAELRNTISTPDILLFIILVALVLAASYYFYSHEICPAAIPGFLCKYQL